MTTICHYDHWLIFDGDVASIPDRDPVPRGWVAAKEPEGKGIWQWQSTKWGKLDKYPQAPPPAPEAGQKSKEEFVAELEARKEKDALVALMDERIDAKLKDFGKVFEKGL